MDKRSWTLVAVLGVATLVITLIALGLKSPVFGGAYDSNGERIYLSATNDRGERITYRGGPAFGGMMMGSRLACASCHGQDARGGVHTMMMQVMDAPDIRWLTLTGEVEGGQQAEQKHEDEHAEVHAEYDLESFRLAVVDGQHPNGEKLSNDMPRWNIRDDDLADVAAFLSSPLLGENELFLRDLMEGGWWIIFPIIGLIVMFMIMGRMGFMRPRRLSRREPHQSDGSERALEILKKRYAKGEISKEEYEEMKNAL